MSPNSSESSIQDYFNSIAERLSTRIATLSIEGALRLITPDSIEELISTLLPKHLLSLKSEKAESFPSEDVHYSKLGTGPSNVGINLRDVIRKVWYVEGPSELKKIVNFNAYQVSSYGEKITAELILNNGMLADHTALVSAKSRLTTIEDELKQRIDHINTLVAKQRLVLIERVTREISTKTQELVEAHNKKKQADDFLNA
jgi:hypothetical protein